MLTWGHPAVDIWSIVYSATDAEYRKDYLESDLQAYYAVLFSYMETKPEFSEFLQELKERRLFGMIIRGFACFLTLSPVKLPHIAYEASKFEKTCQDILIAEDTVEDHPDVREIRRRMMSNMKEMDELNLI